MTVRTKLLGSLFAGVVGAGAFLGVPTVAAAAPAPITWEKCPERVTQHAAKCGRIDVPMDYAHPEGPKISVGFVRLPATGASRGAVFMNPGGPGGDAYTMVAGQTENVFKWPRELRQEWDLIGVQPRGLEGSTPLDLSAETVGVDPFQAATQPVATLKKISDATKPGYADSLNTTNTAKDWEAVREALGLKTISIVGLSYGTQLGSTYATFFPDKVDRLVLDSGYNHSNNWNGVLSRQQAGYVGALHDFLGWVAENDETYHLGTTPLQVYQGWSRKIVAESGTNPTIVPPPASIDDLPPGLQIAGKPAADVLTAIGGPRAQLENLFNMLLHPGSNQARSTTLQATVQMIPQPSMWPHLARIVNGSEELEVLELTEEMQEQALGSLAMQRIVMCNENKVPGYPDRLPEYLWANYVTGDIFAATFLAGRVNAQCNGTMPTAPEVNVSGAALRTKPLQLQGTGDPQTPYDTFGDLTNAMQSHVITVHGPGHGQFGMGNAAVDKAVMEYLRTGHTDVVDAPARPAVDLK